ncbi:MAG: plasmid recombination protein [Lachnospiraceae bacterium]|nr:plasmid recombination protein [Lachnospiraceae bacterium]
MLLQARTSKKSFYEHLVYIGTRKDTGVGTPDAEITNECLREYMEGFQTRNPNFYVFNAVMHLDEATPHLHIDYIPLGHFFNGLEKRNAMARALEEMGYGKGANAINRWRLSEWKVLHDICTKHGFEISEPKKSRGYSFTTAEYGEYKDTIKALEEEKEQAENERAEAQEELEKIAQKRVKFDDIDKLETGRTILGGKVTVAKDDWENITALAKREVASTKQVRKLKKERDEAVQKYDELKDKYDTASEELTAYKKKEKERGLFTREKLKKEAKRISREDELSRELRKAKAFISACGLSDDFARYKFNKTRGSQLE